MLALGRNDFGQLGLKMNQINTPTLVPISDVESISCGQHHTHFLTKSNEVFACGQNTEGQLGTGQQTRKIALVMDQVN